MSTQTPAPIEVPWEQVKDGFIETYISFISDDRESISDSIYTGRIVL